MALDDELRRLSLNPRPRTILHKRTWQEKRDIMIEQRIKALERNRKHLPPEKRWPTLKSIRLHREARLKPGPASVPTATPRKRKQQCRRPTPSDLAELLAPSTSPRSEFPFPVTSSKRGPSFTRFSSLPTEIRFLIWESAFMLEAKFIEVQYSSQFYGPIFFHSFPQASVLFSICRESRELAFFKTTPRSEVNIKSTSSLTQFVSVPINIAFQAACRKKEKLTATRRPSRCLLLHWGQEERDVLGTSLRFNPALDTIFFRSLDQPFGKGGLLELSHRVNNVEWIQHLAVPLCSAYLPPNNEWKRAIANMRDLKTLTYVVGDMNQWVGFRYAKLRDVEEWFVDGRDTRCLDCDFLCLDVKELGGYLSGSKFEKRVKASHGWRFGDEEWKGINVRVVAWKSLS